MSCFEALAFEGSSLAGDALAAGAPAALDIGARLKEMW